MSRTPAPSASIADLPTDLLAYVFAFTSKRTRLGIISFVCRRWRVAALRATTELITYSRNYLWRLLQLFPVLTSLAVDDPSESDVSLVFPATLKSLDLANVLENPSYSLLRPFVGLSGLTALRIVDHGASPDELSRICHSSSASLTSLLLSAAPHIIGQSLESVYLPSLARLKLLTIGDQAVAFISRHCTQLVSLALNVSVCYIADRSHHAARAEDVVGDSKFPLLQKLSVAGDARLLRDLLARCPRTIRLHAQSSECTDDICPLVTKLTLDSPLRVEQLAHFTQLKRVEGCTRADFTVLASSDRLRTQLSRLEEQGVGVLLALSVFTNLASLTARGDVADNVPHAELPRLPRLRQLELVVDKYACERDIATLRCVLRVARPDNLMYYAVWDKLPAGAKGLVGEFLKEADECGVERISLGQGPDLESAVPYTKVMSVLPYNLSLSK